MPLRMKLPEGATGVTFNGQVYDADEEGICEFPDDVDMDKLRKEVPGIESASQYEERANKVEIDEEDIVGQGDDPSLGVGNAPSVKRTEPPAEIGNKTQSQPAKDKILDKDNPHPDLAHDPKTFTQQPRTGPAAGVSPDTKTDPKTHAANAREASEITQSMTEPADKKSENPNTNIPKDKSNTDRK